MQHRRELGGHQALLCARQAIGTEAVIGIDHANACDAHGCQVGHGLFGFTLVGGAHVEHMLAHWLVQHHGPGGWAHQRHAMLVQQRDDGFGVGGAPVQEQRQHVVFFDQLARVFGSELGVELVVQRDELDLLAVDAALGVDHVNVELGSVRGFFHPCSHLPGETCGLPHQQLGLGGPQRGAEGCGDPAFLQGVHGLSLLVNFCCRCCSGVLFLLRNSPGPHVIQGGLGRDAVLVLGCALTRAELTPQYRQGLQPAATALSAGAA